MTCSNSTLLSQKKTQLSLDRIGGSKLELEQYELKTTNHEQI